MSALNVASLTITPSVAPRITAGLAMEVVLIVTVCPLVAVKLGTPLVWRAKFASRTLVVWVASDQILTRERLPRSGPALVPYTPIWTF